MKAILAAALMSGTGACSYRVDYAAPAKICAQEQINRASRIDASLRQLVASRCASQIEDWAMKGLAQLQGRPVDLSDVRSRQEYADGKQAIIQMLVPLGDGPKRK